MKYAENNQLRDPFDLWKRMRNERYASLKLVAYAITGLSLAFFLYVSNRHLVRRRCSATGQGRNRLRTDWRKVLSYRRRSFFSRRVYTNRDLRSSG